MCNEEEEIQEQELKMMKDNKQDDEEKPTIITLEKIPNKKSKLVQTSLVKMKKKRQSIKSSKSK